jgi:hypothetical protein
MGEFRHRHGKLVIVVQYFIMVVYLCVEQSSTKIGAIIFPMFPVLTSGYWFRTHMAYFMNYIRIDNGVSNGGTHTIISTLTIVYWYVVLIKIWNIKVVKSYQS